MEKKDLTSLIELSQASEMPEGVPETIAETAPQAVPEIVAEPVSVSESAPEPQTVFIDPQPAAEPTTPEASAAAPDQFAGLNLGEPIDSSTAVAAAAPTLSEPSPETSEVSNEPPVYATHLKNHPLGQEVHTSPDLEEIQKYGEKIAIGKPRVEASPAFTFFAKSSDGFSERALKAIEGALGKDDYGVRFDDVAVQLKSGKLLVPRISEFAAISLAQQLRDAVDDIEIQPSSDPEPVFNADPESLHRATASNLVDRPASISDVFTTNLDAPSGFKITRILSLVSATKVLAAEAAKQESPEFETATESLTHELSQKAFQLGANAVIGIRFTLHPVGHSGEKPVPGDRTEYFRLFGQGTAVCGRKTENS